MNHNLPMKWNSFYKFWTVLNCVGGTIWCIALAALLVVYSFAFDLISPFLSLFNAVTLDAFVSLVVRLLANGIIFTILSYITVPTLGRYSKSGLIRIYLQTLAAAVGHLLKIIFLMDLFAVMSRTMPSLDLNNMDIGLYVVFAAAFIVRFIIFIAGIVYYYKRKARRR